MTYSNKNDLIDLLKKENLWTKKSLGQNFLVNPQIISKIAAAADIQSSDNVIEVGPGLGILTEELAKKAKRVRTIELDRRLIPILEKKFSSFPNVEIEHADALKTTLPAFPYKLVANIPYYITSPLINHFLRPKTPREKRPSLLVLLVQKEVAEKICAGEGDHSILSLQVQIYGKPEIAGHAGKSSFFPQPKVDSAIIKIETFREPLIRDEDRFFTLIKAAFSQKRKQLVNSLQSGLKKSRSEIESAFANAGISSSRRPETLTIAEWQKLVESI